VQAWSVTVAVRALVALVCLLGVCAPSARAALPFLKRKPPAPPVVAPVAEPTRSIPWGR